MRRTDLVRRHRPLTAALLGLALHVPFLVGAPDDLADVRMLVRSLEDGREQAVVVPGWAWMVEALSGAAIEAAESEDRRPAALERVAAHERIAIVLDEDEEFEADRLTVASTDFVSDGPPRRVAGWAWYPFRAASTITP